MKIDKIILSDSKKTFDIFGTMTHEELVNNRIGEMRESILVNSKSFDVPVTTIMRGKEIITKYLKLPKEFYGKFDNETKYFGKFVIDSNGKQYFIMECE